MATALRYENFICDAFGFSSGSIVKRFGDPAGLADTDKFNEKNIDTLKAAIAYSMEILSKAAANRISSDDLGLLAVSSG